ncbi:hypothetical protein BJ138DRAFT_1220151 [Hygrophoropsis aurantiaca]|uniref:Uncharacterized protein n=1 Tax=Hygrophoropsis aurantiaca TaxID=72124 RepID=A0ACB8AJZ4_9AGAM|nr:hypothetical protein BJ138DRAFT_1220151 [Hygrophoropsis aurantiaca]
MTRTTSRKEKRSPPPSPTKLLRAKLLVSKAERSKKSAQTAKSRKNSTDEAPGNKPGSSGARVILVDWSNPEFHHLTDKLLAIIAEHPVYKVAFGFDKGTESSVNSGGKKLKAHHESLAQKVFLLDDLGLADPSSQFASSPIDKLGVSVKNRIKNLKENYIKHRDQIGATGQGLLDEDRESEITAGSELANIWDKVKVKFPWYMTMHRLMGTSPVADRSAIAHSGTSLDLTILHPSVSADINASGIEGVDADGETDAEANEGTDHKFALEHSPAWDFGGDDKAFDSDHESEPISLPSSPRIPSATKATPKPVQRGRKSIADSLQEITAAERETRISVAKANAKEKTAREGLKRKALVEVERLRIEFQREEGERKRRHEFQMMQARLELARHMRNQMQGAGTSASHQQMGSLWAELQAPLDSDGFQAPGDFNWSL